MEKKEDKIKRILMIFVRGKNVFLRHILNNRK